MNRNFTDVTGHRCLEMLKTYSRDAEAFVGHAAGLLGTGILFEIRLIMMFAIELVVATIIACANLFHSPSQKAKRGTWLLPQPCTISTRTNEGESARESHDGKARGRLFAPGSLS